MRVGIIGCGFIARKHVACLRRLDGIPLVAVADTLPERVRDAVERYGRAGGREPEPHLDYRRLLDDPQVDAVLVSVPNGLHARIAEDALTCGKHVVVEKPLALSTGEAARICELAAAAGRQAVVCHQKRFYPHLGRVRELVRGGAIGRVVSAEVVVMLNRGDEYYGAAAWRGTWTKDGGMLLNQGIHDIDLLVWIMGEPAEVMGRLSRQSRPTETEDTAAAALAYADGAVATVLASVCAAPGSVHERLSIFGTDGAVVLAGKRLDGIVRWDVPGVPPPPVACGDPYEALYRDLRDAVERNRRPLVDARAAARTLRTVFAVYRSHLTRAPASPSLGAFSTCEMKGVFDRRV